MKKLLSVLCLLSITAMAGYNPKWIKLNKPYDTGIVQKDSGQTFNFKFEFQKSIGTYVSFDYSIGTAATVTIVVDNPPANVYVDSTTYADRIVVDLKLIDITDQTAGWLDASAQMGTKVQYVSGFVANSLVLINRAIASTNLNYQSTLFIPGLTDVLPGEKIYLEAVLVPNNLEIVGYNWTIEGTTFKSYAPDAGNSNLVELVPNDFKNQKMTYYWCDSGNPRKVTAAISCKLARIPVIKVIDDISNFNVGKPKFTETKLTQGTSKFGPKPKDHDDNEDTPDLVNGAVYYIDPINNEGLNNGGFEIGGKVDVPNGFAQGTWQYVQVLNEKTIWWVTMEPDAKFQSSMHDKTVLDKNYPYDGPYNTGVVGETRDTPSFAYAVWLYNPVTEVSHLEFTSWNQLTDFQMNIEFKPAGFESVFIPLEYVKWQFKCNVTWPNNVPVLTTFPGVPLVRTPWGANLPQTWDKNIKDENYIPVPAP